MLEVVNKMLKLKLRGWSVICVLITCIIPNTLQAQLINNNNWFFGSSDQALIFTKADTMATIEENIQAVPFGTGGSAVISSEFDGNMIFYSDGANVYDATHIVVPNGSGLNGNTSLNQPVVAAPVVMTSNTNWYLYVNTGTEIESTLVSFTTSGNATQTNQPPLGDVSVAQKNIPTGLLNTTPAMAIIRSGSLTSFGFWLVTQDASTSEFRVTEASGSAAAVGVTTPYSDAAAPLITAENFSVFNQGDTLARIAVSPQTANANVQIWQLDLLTGVMSFDRVILNSGNADDVAPAIYDTEWSSDGTKLYISRHGSSGTAGDLLQFDFLDTLGNVNSILPANVFRSFGLKLGPNDTLYHLYQPTSVSAIELGAVTRPLQTFDSTAYDLEPFPNDNFAGFQFPEFPQPTSSFALINFTFDEICMNNPTKFSPEVDPPPLSYFWDFNGEGNSTAHSPVFTFTTAGIKNVSLTVTLEDAVETFSRSVDILDPQTMIMLPNDTTLCRGESLPLDPMPDMPPLSTVWNTRETTQSIVVDSVGLVDPGGTYWVAMETAAGCLVYDEIVITIYEDTTTNFNQWYFGDMAGIDFNQTPAVAVTDGVSQSPEAAATFSDANGDLLMYTNGVTVYNRDHVRMVNGDSLGGDSTSAQGALIVQLPMDETIYYIFMTDPAWEDGSFDLRYAMVDLKLDSARGAVVFKNRPLYSRSTERLTASGFGDAGAVWLLSHEFGNNTFRAYLIDENGIGEPVYSTEGTILSPAIEGHSRNYLKFVNGQVVMTISDPDVPGENFVELFDFDPATGKVSNPRTININEPAPAEVYGVEISGDRLWVTTRGGAGSKLIQFDIDTTDVATIEASKFDGYTVNEELGAIETGPNGTVYIATNGQTSLSQIGSPQSDDADATYDANVFPLDGRTSTFGLPNFVRNSAGQATGLGLNVGPGCRGQTISMSVTGLSQIDFIDWIFGDGSGIDSTQVSDTTHVYNIAQDYTVQARVFNRCGLDTLLSQQITINVDIPTPTAPAVTAICDQTLDIDAYANNPGLAMPSFRYNWSTGDTTQVVTVTGPSSLTVSVTDVLTGCVSDTLTVLVADGRPQVDLGPPLTVCAGEQVGPLDAANPQASYAWTINGTASGSGRFQNVNTGTAGVFDYQVSVTDPLTGCIGTGAVTITVNELPDVTLTPTATSGCGNSDGFLDLVFNDASNFSYTVVSGGASGGPVTSGTFAGPGTLNIPNLVAGSYSVTATNQVTNCSNTVSANIDDSGANFTAALAANPDCGSNGFLTLTLSDAGGGVPTIYNYELIDNAGVSVRQVTGETANPLNITNLDTGTYNIVIQRVAPVPPCIQTAQVNLSELPPATITVDPIYNFCDGQGTIPATVVAPAILTWTLPNGSIAVTNNLVATQSGTYSVTSSDGGGTLCPQTETVEVIISENPAIAIDVVGDQCDGMLTLNASTDASGASSFVWGSSDSNNGAVGPSITATQPGTFSVTTRDQGTGCLATASEDVNVEPVLELFISSEPDCDNNPNVFLRAESNITADVTFEWTGPGGILPDTTAIISVDSTGLYTARVIRINSGCDASASFNLVVEPIDDEDLILPTRAIFCPLDPTTATTTLDPGSFNTYEWRLLPDQTVISTSRTLTVSTPGEYEVTLFNGFTCTRDNIIVAEDCTPRIFAPNAFTPNGDGLNDNFFVFNNPFVTDFRIWIYNRWGELVFQSNTIDFRWDGMFRGEMATVGTFAWVARFNSSVEPELGEIEEHGAVTLIR